MPPSLHKLPEWFCVSDPGRFPNSLISRWIFLRSLGLIFFSAFYSLLFQVDGLIGSQGLLPAGVYLETIKRAAGASRFWYAPTLLWFGTGTHALLLLCWVGIVASILLLANIWPRGMVAVCLVAFLSFISVLQAFSSYQSDGMLLGAAFLCLFFAPSGWRPGWGEHCSPSRASLFLLQWLWFTIYFESGLVKILSGDQQWRAFTAMDEYYQNGPLPTWIAWHAQHLPHWFHAGSAVLTLVLELLLVWMLFLPRRFRIVLFWIVTPWQIGIILTSNYAFLNYLVLALGILLLDDEYLKRFVPQRFGTKLPLRAQATPPTGSSPALARGVLYGVTPWVVGIALLWIFYATTAQLAWLIYPAFPLPEAPVIALEPFRIAESYGLFATMTRGRYEIEFQGSNDGANWIAYPFRYKPQDLREAPRIYAPYQPRFEWNLWFASLDKWQSSPFVVNTEVRLLQNTPSVLALFRTNPFPNAPPRLVRTVLWQYWFSDREEKKQGFWWRRNLLEVYAPTMQRDNNGMIGIVPDGAAASP